jgi:hypothetical protein
MVSYIHDVCQRQFDSQESLDNHVANPLDDPVCRVNEGQLLIEGINCSQNCGPGTPFRSTDVASV